MSEKYIFILPHIGPIVIAYYAMHFFHSFIHSLTHPLNILADIYLSTFCVPALGSCSWDAVANKRNAVVTFWALLQMLLKNYLIYSSHPFYKKCPFYTCRNANAEILSKFCTVTEPVIDGAVIHTQMYQTSKLTFSLLNRVVPMQNIHVSLLFI